MIIKYLILDTTGLVVNSLFVLQVYRRLYECLFISKFSPEARMNGLIYAIGFWHYFGAILSIYGGGGCGDDINVLRTVIAVPIFIFGWIKQLEAHVILGSLRTGRK